MKEYGIRYSKFDRNDRIKTVEKFFATKAARDKFAAKVEQHDDFYEFVAWLG